MRIDGTPRGAWLAIVLAGAIGCGEGSTAASASAPSEAGATALLRDLTDDDPAVAGAALERVAGEGDARFVAALIELLRAAQIGIAPTLRPVDVAGALDRLAGPDLGADWPAWVEWYGRTDLSPPPGFTGWKGRLYARIDPRFGELLRDDAPARLRVEEVQWGGVAFEGIPALDRAPQIPAAKASWLADEDLVFGLALGDEARAYPLRILDWHEMANDVVGGVPVSLAYCTLCGAGIAYDGRAPDGGTYDFGSSGFLYRSNKLMVDRQTGTLWNHLTGRPVLGPLAGGDLALRKLPVALTTWKSWRERHPGTTVLSLETGHERPYVAGAAYGSYFASPETMFPVAQRSAALAAKARVLGLEVRGVPKAYPIEGLVAAGVVNDEVGGSNVAVIARGPALRVAGESLKVGPIRYDAGAEVAAYERGARRFAAGPQPDSLLDEQGRRWRVTADALLGPDGERAPRMESVQAYWFGWFAFFPRTLVYGAAE